MKVIAKLDMDKINSSSIPVDDKFIESWQPDKVRVFTKSRDIKGFPQAVDSLTGSLVMFYWLDIVMEKSDE